MSKVAIKGNASGTGTFTLEAPNSNTDRTLSLPDEAGTVLTSGGAIADALNVDSAPSDSLEVDSSSNLKFNSGYGSVATAYGCRAWVNFKGDGTVAIRDSGNVSSITDNGTGNYTLSFSSAMVDSNYAAVLGSVYVDWIASLADMTTTSIRVNGAAADGSSYDTNVFCFAIFR